MRGLSLAAAALLSLGVTLGPMSDAGAEPAEDGGGATTTSGSSQTAAAEILSAGEVEVTAGESSSIQAVSGGGGGGDISCHFKLGDGMGAGSVGAALDPFNPPPALVGRTLTFMRVCVDGVGNYVSIEYVTATLPLQGSDPVVVDPRALALMARSRLPVPEPRVGTSPALDRQQIVNLSSWLWVENWGPVSAGGVTATATARPVSHRWVFGPGEWRECFSAEARYDYSRPAYEQSTDCSYTFLHDSTIQPDGVYHVEVSITWEVTWTSNIGAGGELGPVSRSTSLDMVVGEIQALNTSGEGP